MEKTGTTSIQSLMSENRKVLGESGYRYSWSMGRENHVNLVVYARDDDKTDNQRKRAFANSGLPLDKLRKKIEADFAVEAEKHAGQHLILSNEHLQSRLTCLREKKRLRSLLEPHCEDIEVYLYLRRQDLVATSLYGTRLLSGGMTHLGDIIPKIADGAEVPYFYNYLLIYREFCEAFGKDKVHVRIFEKERLLGQDICTDFLDWLGIKTQSPIQFTKRQNESISEAAQFFLTRFNTNNPPFIDEKLNPLRGQIAKRFARIATGKGYKPEREMALSFMEHFREDNATLFKEAGLGDVNFEDSFDMFPAGSGKPAVPEVGDVADVGVSLFQDVMKDLNQANADLAKLRAKLKKLKA
jgi:hypothetical protein